MPLPPRPWPGPGALGWRLAAPEPVRGCLSACPLGRGQGWQEAAVPSRFDPCRSQDHAVTARPGFAPWPCVWRESEVQGSSRPPQAVSSSPGQGAWVLCLNAAVAGASHSQASQGSSGREEKRSQASWTTGLPGMGAEPSIHGRWGRHLGLDLPEGIGHLSPGVPVSGGCRSGSSTWADGG